MPKYPWGLVSSCLNEQWLYFQSLRAVILPHQITVVECLLPCREGQQAACSSCLVLTAWKGKLGWVCCMAKHWYAHHCWGGTWWVSADWAVISQEGQHWPLLPLGTDWSTILLSCPLLLFCLFFLGVLYFFMSVFFFWVLELLMITISAITLWYVFSLFLSCRDLAHGLSHSSATVFSMKLSQNPPVVPHQFWATASWMLGWRLRGYSYLEINGTSKWLSGWGMERSCCICLRCSQMALLDQKNFWRLLPLVPVRESLNRYWTL